MAPLPEELFQRPRPSIWTPTMTKCRSICVAAVRATLPITSGSGGVPPGLGRSGLPLQSARATRRRLGRPGAFHVLCVGCVCVFLSCFVFVLSSLVLSCLSWCFFGCGFVGFSWVVARKADGFFVICRRACSTDWLRLIGLGPLAPGVENVAH